MCGISPRHIRRLCDNPWDGGMGYTPNEVGGMTLDQIYMLLTDRVNLRVGGKRSTELDVDQVAASLPRDTDGSVKVKTDDGAVIKLKMSGKSYAQILAEQDAEESKAKALEENKNRRKTRHERWLERQKKGS